MAATGHEESASCRGGARSQPARQPMGALARAFAAGKAAEAKSESSASSSLQVQAHPEAKAEDSRQRVFAKLGENARFVVKSDGCIVIETSDSENSAADQVAASSSSRTQDAGKHQTLKRRLGSKVLGRRPLKLKRTTAQRVQQLPQRESAGQESTPRVALEKDVPLSCLTWIAAEKKLSPMSLCRLRSCLGSQGSSSPAAIGNGDLLLALAGAHSRFSIDASVAGLFRDMLKPCFAETRPEWSLKPHQEEGYRWLMSRSAMRLGSILADDMGLGKTRQAISWLFGIRSALSAASTSSSDKSQSSIRKCPFQTCTACGREGCGHPGCKPLAWERALIVAPAMLVRGEDSLWIKELRDAEQLWGERCNVWQWHGERAVELRSKIYRASWSGPMLELFDVVVVSYESFLLNQEEFCRENWTCVILDEAQSIKNRRSQIAEATKKLAKAPFRLAMTGTPIENSLEDFHSILQFVQPDCAGSVHDFWERFPPTDEGRATLRRLVPLVALRRESGIAIKMVPKEEVEIPVPMSEVQQSVYSMAMEQQASVFKRIKDAELVCTHPWCFASLANADARSKLPEHLLGEAVDQSISDSKKMEELFRILRGLLSCRQKVLLFFCRTITSELVAALIGKEFGTRPGIVRGDTASGERDRLIREFRTDPDTDAPHSQVLLLSVWVGAVGLNLPEARWVVHIERVWNPALERQATSRVHRINSKQPVKAYCLYTEGTVEEHKRTVLVRKHKLSTHIIDSLDGDLEEDGEEMQSTPPELQELVSGIASPGDAANEAEDELLAEAGNDQEEAISDSSDEESGVATGAKKSRENQGLYPTFDKLKPRTMKEPLKGKYGDPKLPELWRWYAEKGHKDLHPKAAETSTAGYRQRKQGGKQPGHTATKFASRPARVNDAKAREDWVVEVDLKGTSCRLFVPKHLRKHFTQTPDGELGVRQAASGVVPFPILMPSFGRSALDVEVGLLDLTGTMVKSDGSALEFLQIVGVKPSEVDKYRSSGPSFVVMELPSERVCEHPLYGTMSPEELGIGCARHWLMRLAGALKMQHIFMMDDSVRAWLGLTLVQDPHPMFGHVAGKKARFTPRMPLARVLEHFATSDFLSEFSKFSVLGFARLAPESFRTKCAYKRGHVYSAFLVNVERVLHEQGINFNENLFIWEDLDFNLRVKDVCKCFRFAMIKKPYDAGGCSNQIARGENPYVRALQAKFTPEEIATEAVERQSLGYDVRKKLAPPKHKRSKKAAGNGDDEATEDNSAELMGRSVFELEADVAFQPEGAILDENGRLLSKYYTRFIEAFKDKERSCWEPTCGTVNRTPGMRRNEEWPEGLRIWDDTKKSKDGRTVIVVKGKGKEKVRHVRTFWGAGWKAAYPFKKQEGLPLSVWFNIRKWKTWRLAFILARLQAAVWRAKGEVEGLEFVRTPVKRRQKDGAPDSDEKKKRTRLSLRRRLPFTETKKQPTLMKFFGAKKQEPSAPSQPTQQTIKSFFKSAQSKDSKTSE